jgi:predicted AAA+ superfamily ATPase
MSQDAPITKLIERLDRIARHLETRFPPPATSIAPLPEGRAFLWDPAGEIRAVRRPAVVDPEVLTGVDHQKTAFYENVGRFLAGAPSHDVLLWGERGTGKSSLVRSLLVAFDRDQLGLVAVPEARIPDLPRVLDVLDADRRRWLLYLDDLSFGGPGHHYRELKVLLEGGLEARPENTVAVATSNRRHLVPEAFPAAEEIHPEETVAETVSLADRFGLSLGFYAFDEATYLEAVTRHLAALGIEALRWAMARGIRSGRTALQAAREIAGRVAGLRGPDNI